MDKSDIAKDLIALSHVVILSFPDYTMDQVVDYMSRRMQFTKDSNMDLMLQACVGIAYCEKKLEMEKNNK